MVFSLHWSWKKGGSTSFSQKLINSLATNYFHKLCLQKAKSTPMTEKMNVSQWKSLLVKRKAVTFFSPFMLTCIFWRYVKSSEKIPTKTRRLEDRMQARWYRYETLCAIWYHFYNLKRVENTHGRFSLLVKLQTK